MSTQTTDNDRFAKRGVRSRIKRSLRRLSDRITADMSLEEIVREISGIHEKAAALQTEQQGSTHQSTHSLEPGGADINIQQFWRHNDSGRIVQITNIQMGPVYRPGDTVTAWVPEKIFFRDIADETRQEQGLVVYFWRRLMTELKTDEVKAVEPEGSKDTAEPEQRLYALVSTQGTAISETALEESDFTPANRARMKADAPADWDGGDFHDVTENDALREALNA